MTEPAKLAYVFPGQGSQSVGMGRDLYESFASVKDLFAEANKAVGFPLSRLCFEGPEEELRLTVNTQPAIVLVSIACLQVMREVHGSKTPTPAFVAGHSLGEYTALAAANVLDPAITVYLARERGRLMYEAGLKRPGAMAAVLGMDETILGDVCRETDTRIANFNSPGQLVISGAAENIAKAAELAKTKGASRVVPLQVSGAFHSPLMQPAVDGLAKIIPTLNFRDPSVPIIANTTGQPVTTADVVKSELLNQLCDSVQWQRSIEYMINNGVTTFIEIGPGKVLSGLIKRINKNVNTLNVGDVESIKKLNI